MAGSTRRDRLLSPRRGRILTVVLALLVLALSLIPKSEQVPDTFGGFDKLGHFIAYAVLAFFAMRAVDRCGLIPFVVVVVACTIFGGIIEIVQPIVGRTMELADFLVDLAGAAGGAVLAAIPGRTNRRT